MPLSLECACPNARQHRKHRSAPNTANRIFVFLTPTQAHALAAKSKKGYPKLLHRDRHRSPRKSAIMSRRSAAGQEEVAVRKRRGGRRVDLSKPGPALDDPEAKALFDEPGDIFADIGTG